jgi:hypothetical protein
MSIAFAAETNSAMHSGDLADPTAFVVANQTRGVDEFEPIPSAR